MKKLLLMASVLLATGAAQADDGPLWMRYPAISPDGTTIAFTYCGDIFTVPVGGGRATQLTTNPAYDSRPVWSPDGKQIAFASDREGGFDVFIMSRDGGAPTRLTTHSTTEIPVAFADSTHVLLRHRYSRTIRTFSSRVVSSRRFTVYRLMAVVR